MVLRRSGISWSVERPVVYRVLAPQGRPLGDVHGYFVLAELNLLHLIARAGEFSMASVLVKACALVTRRRLLSSANGPHASHSATSGAPFRCLSLERRRPSTAPPTQSGIVDAGSM